MPSPLLEVDQHTRGRPRGRVPPGDPCEEADVTDEPSRAFALTAAQERLQAEARALAREVLAPLVEAAHRGA